MTTKQIDRIKKKIAGIRHTLAGEKRKFGCYDDSRGLRYLPTKYFIQLGDYSGGLSYLRWFDKNFPDDSGVPEFMFERTIIFFKSSKTTEAAQNAFKTFCSNPYWLDKYFGRSIQQPDIWKNSNLATADYTEALEYSSEHEALTEFSEWFYKLISTEDFSNRSLKYIDIYRRLRTESDTELRHYLLQQAYQLEEGR